MFLQKTFAQGDEQRFLRLEKEFTVLADSLIPKLNDITNLSVNDLLFPNFVRALAEAHNLNVSIDPELNFKISNNFNNVIVKDLLVFLCREFDLDIKILGSIISFTKYKPPNISPPLPLPKKLTINYLPEEELFSVDLKADSLLTFAKAFTRLTKRNLIFSPALRAKILFGYIENMKLKPALQSIAFENDLKLTSNDDGTFVFEQVDAPLGTSKQNQQQGISGNESTIDIREVDGKKLLTINASNVNCNDLFKTVSAKLGIQYVLYTELKGNSTVKVKNATYNNFLDFLMKGTPYTYRMEDGIYLIGERIAEGFRTTRLVKLFYRSVNDITDYIPEEIRKTVYIKAFTELNSLVLSGGAPEIIEVENFIKAIDQPVVNILIEVIVVELRKGRTISTGISAFLSDSTVTTGGSILPGVDVTVGSDKVNKLIEKLNASNIINLGQVTPNFYLKLQALESSNNINIRSTPKLSTLNGHDAELKIGETVYYLEQTQNITGGVNPIQTISQHFKPVSADLNIKISPNASGDNHVTLTITAEFSNFIDPTIVGAPPGNATRKFTSMIRIRNEEMIVLGGLEETSHTKTGSGTPILSRIPILKWLFSSRSDIKQRDQLLVFIRPSIVY